MLSVLGGPKRTCDGITRRDLLQAGSLGLLGTLGLPGLLEAEGLRRNQPQRAAGGAPRFAGKAKSVILLNLFGGPPTQDMWDMKPQAPLEVRGPFRPIATSAPGVQICEHLPRMAKWMHRSALIRSINRTGNDHTPLPMLTGYTGPTAAGSFQASPSDPPSVGSVMSYLGMGNGTCPPYVQMPCDIGWGQNTKRPGQYAGFLGKQYDPLVTECSPHVPLPATFHLPQIVRGTPQLPMMSSAITLDRLRSRRTLLGQLDLSLRDVGDGPLVGHNEHYHQAFNLLTSPECRAAFDLDQEDPRIRDRYGRSLWGESTLIARRLIERGARFVSSTYDLFWTTTGKVAVSARDVDANGWDLHYDAHLFLKDLLLPQLDMVYNALMEDLERTGLLDETLVVVLGEMGRTAQINPEAGRGHWTQCYSVMLSGAGIQGGAVWGASDKRAEWPSLHPTSPGDLCATVYRALGIDPEMVVHDRANRPISISHGGKPIDAILA